MTDPDRLTPEARARLDAWLDTVEQALAAGGAQRSERRGVTDDLEAQVLDMLDERPEGPIDAPAVEAVLERLDPPEAYAEGAAAGPAALPRAPGEGGLPPAPPKPKRKGRRLPAPAVVGAVVGLAVLPILAIVAVVFGLRHATAQQERARQQAMLHAQQHELELQTRQAAEEALRQIEQGPGQDGAPAPSSQEEPSLAQPSDGHARAAVPMGPEARSSVNWVAVFIGVPAALVGLGGPITMILCGIVAIIRIRQRPKELYGTGLAVFDVLFYPLLFADYLILALLAYTLAGRMGLGLVGTLPITGIVAIGFDVLAFIVALRLARPATAKESGGSHGGLQGAAA